MTDSGQRIHGGRDVQRARRRRGRRQEVRPSGASPGWIGAGGLFSPMPLMMKGAGGVHRLGIARRTAGAFDRIVEAHERAGRIAAQHVAFAAIGRDGGVGVRRFIGDGMRGEFSTSTMSRSSGTVLVVASVRSVCRRASSPVSAALKARRRNCSLVATGELGVRDVHADDGQQRDDHQQDQADDQGSAALSWFDAIHECALLLP